MTESSSERSKLKHDWYQTESHVIITLFIKQITKEHVNIDFQNKEVSISIKQSSSKEFFAHFDLWHFIRPNDCLFKVYSTKIEIKLKKKEGLRWDTLEGDVITDIKQINTNSTGSSGVEYPTSSVKKHDWNKIEAEVKKVEETEKPEGEAALQDLFQNIYAGGNEEVKRAMKKSFVESGGTVLSTNWKDVGKEEVEVKAPDGMEYTKWEK